MDNNSKNDDKKPKLLDYNPEYTWEYNLTKQVRWGTDDEKDDIFFYVKNWISKIAEDEGYILKKENNKNDVS